MLKSVGTTYTSLKKQTKATPLAVERCCLSLLPRVGARPLGVRLLQPWGCRAITCLARGLAYAKAGHTALLARRTGSALGT